MPTMIAVDPGDVHVGVAFFEPTFADGETADPWRGSPEMGQHWECVDTQEMTPNQFLDALAETLLADDLRILVFERFRLYGDKSREQIGSEMPTAQMIGVIRYLVRIHNGHVRRHAQAEVAGKMMTCELPGGSCATHRPKGVRIVGQMADIQKPTTGILRHKGIKSTAKAQKTGAHTLSAELHGWYFLFKNFASEDFPEGD